MDLELFKSTKVFTFHVHPITLDSQVTTILFKFYIEIFNYFVGKLLLINKKVILVISSYYSK